MAKDFHKLMSNKTDEGLESYLDNRSKFTPEAIEGAIFELKNRGRVFSEDELNVLKRDIQQKRTVEENENKKNSFNQWKKNVVTDKSAPEYFSERAIYMFSVFFSVLFGSIVLATNLYKTKSKKGIWQVILFGIVYTGLQLYCLSLIPRNSLLTLVVSMGGALILNYYFWSKFIGKETKYRTKAIWIPLIIGLIIYIPIIFATIYYGNEN